eukprot:scaffold3349_cov246-Pinguiococcus_pyrenoidosus.AAC.11
MKRVAHLQLRLLCFQERREQLLFQRRCGDGRVYHGAVLQDLCGIPRVGQWRLQHQLERRVVLNVDAAHSKAKLLLAVEYGASQDRKEAGVNHLLQALDHNRRPGCNTRRHRLKPLGFPTTNALHGLVALDPADALPLRVDEQRPASGGADDGGALDGLQVRRYSVFLPPRQSGVADDNAEGIHVV